MPISVSALNRGRRVSEAGMPDECEAIVPTDGTVWDPVALADVPEVTVRYAGRCELKWSDQVTVSSGVTVEGYVLKVPASAPGLPVGTNVTLTKSRSDHLLPGAIVTVRKLLKGSHIMARRYQVVEATGPGE